MTFIIRCLDCGEKIEEEVAVIQEAGKEHEKPTGTGSQIISNAALWLP